MKYFSVSSIWPDSTVFIIGGGPSLSKIDLSLFSSGNYRVIGINMAYILGDWINILFFADKKFWNWFKEDLKKYSEEKRNPGWIITHCENIISEQKQYPFLKFMRRNPDSISWKKIDTLGWMGNSGISAINLAIHLGAKRIILLGFDGKQDENGKDNWHNQYKIKLKSPKFTYDRFQEGFEKLANQLKVRKDIQVLNATPESAIQSFPIVKLKDCL